MPFIARWPARLPAGRITNEFLTSLELLPTLAAAAAANLPPVTHDGFDAMPVLSGAIASPREEMFWQRRNDIGARVGKWKWVAMANGGGLFDLATDLAEKNDLSKKRPEELAHLQSRYNQWRQSMDSSEPRGPFRDD